MTTTVSRIIGVTQVQVNASLARVMARNAIRIANARVISVSTVFVAKTRVTGTVRRVNKAFSHRVNGASVNHIRTIPILKTIAPGSASPVTEVVPVRLPPLVTIRTVNALRIHPRDTEPALSARRMAGAMAAEAAGSGNHLRNVLPSPVRETHASLRTHVTVRGHVLIMHRRSVQTVICVMAQVPIAAPVVPATCIARVRSGSVTAATYVNSGSRTVKTVPTTVCA